MRQFTINDILVTFFFPSPEQAMGAVMGLIHQPPRELRPDRVGTHENPRAGLTLAVSENAITQVIRACPIGFFLFGERRRWRASVNLGRGANQSHIDYWLAASSDLYLLAPHLVEIADAHSAEYGYGGHFEEIKLRNQLRLNVGPAQALIWCGRDFRRYIPGLYWCNYFSDQYSKNMRVDLAQIDTAICGNIRRHSNGSSFLMFENPRDWQSHYDEVSRAMTRVERVFRKEVIEVPSHLEYSEIDGWLHKLGQEWP